MSVWLGNRLQFSSTMGSCSSVSGSRNKDAPCHHCLQACIVIDATKKKLNWILSYQRLPCGFAVFLLELYNPTTQHLYGYVVNIGATSCMAVIVAHSVAFPSLAFTLSVSFGRHAPTLVHTQGLTSVFLLLIQNGFGISLWQHCSWSLPHMVSKGCFSCG